MCVGRQVQGRLVCAMFMPLWTTIGKGHIREPAEASVLTGWPSPGTVEERNDT